MRKIKFRVWDKKDKHMFYVGSLSGVSDFYLAKYQNKDYHTYEELYNKFSNVDYDWMEFTGLCERTEILKVNKEIYFGDIVRCFGGECYQGSHEYDTEFIVENYYDCVEIAESEYVEILGNVYDNPELKERIDKKNTSKSKSQANENLLNWE